MQYAIVPVTPFQQNCTFVFDETTKRGAIVDPGGDLDVLLGVVEREGLTIERILLTHGHLDHASAAGVLAERLGVPIEGPHEDERFLLDALPRDCALMGFPIHPRFEPSRWLRDGDTVSVGGATLEVLHCPGHTPGHVVFFAREDGVALVGDVLFSGSVGRTDFDHDGVPYGSFDTLARSIREKLFPLGDQVEFISGHGPPSSFGQERQTNPFVGDRARLR